MLALYAHPFSSYSQKALIALYESGIGFDYRHLEDADARAEFDRLAPIGRFPVLVADGRTVLESTAIIEYLHAHHAGAAGLLPADPDAAIGARMLDRIFDQYVMTPMQKIVLDHLRPDGARDAHGVAEARALLDRAYAWIDAHMHDRTWASGANFGLADCAAAPALFYADWVHAIGTDRPHLQAYRARLLARPSVARAVDEARPYRHYFPPGAPDRD